MMVLVGGMIPSSFLIPTLTSPPTIISLHSTWQVPSLLLCALVCGPRSGVIASVAYITIGLFYLPVFHGGGNLDYLLSPSFGFLAGFIPAVWITARFTKHTHAKDLIGLTLSAIAGLACIHFFGILYLIFGSILGLWTEALTELLYSFSLAPLPAQLAICPAVGILSLILRRLLLIK